MKYEKGDAVVELLGVALFLASVVAWFTHVVVCIKAASWGFLIAGAVFFPIAIVHGGGVWFGAW